MPPPAGKGKGKGGKALAKQGGAAEDHSFDEVVSEHSKQLEELRERQERQVRRDFRFFCTRGEGTGDRGEPRFFGGWRGLQHRARCAIFFPFFFCRGRNDDFFCGR